MGVIEDGCVSGYVADTEVFAINYPAYPSTTSRALHTLGGISAISQVRSSHSKQLELRFRPEDPYSHSAYGNPHPCQNFLLKISKKKSNNDHNSQVSTKFSADVEAPVTLSADIVARVSEAYHFNGMVDYQHVLAVHAHVARSKKRNWADVETDFEKDGLLDVEQEDLMLLVPSLFSPKDVPEKLVLRQSAALSSKTKQDGIVQHRWEMDIEKCLAIDFEVEEIPKEVNWKEYISEGSEHWEYQMVVSELFDERPIWHKNSLIDRLNSKGLRIGDYLLRRLLFRTSYYFSNGPFLKFWIRKGYDPRIDPESRIYQKTDFRVPPPLRGHCDAALCKRLKHKWEDICSFRVFPYKCQTSLQLFELADDYIQQEIRKKPSNSTTCTVATGWFSFHELSKFRYCVAVRFLSVYPDRSPAVENLLKSASERLKRSKRPIILASTSRQGDEGHQQQLNKELVDNEDKDEQNDDDDEEEEEDEDEEEIEAENGEEELDAGYNGDFSLQPDGNGENISRSYLQELFGSFPSMGAGDGDDEYQIYEQDSDGNYSDGDDY